MKYIWFTRKLTVQTPPSLARNGRRLSVLGLKALLLLGSLVVIHTDHLVCWATPVHVGFATGSLDSLKEFPVFLSAASPTSVFLRYTLLP